MNGDGNLAEVADGRASPEALVATLATVTPAGVPTGSLQDVGVPEAGVYEVDPAHSSVEFVARHLGLGRVRGRFNDFSGIIHVADDPRASSVEVMIDATSIDTGEAARDEHLRSADFLNVGTYPRIEFHSTGVRDQGGRWLVDGNLTVRGVTRPVTLEVEFDGSARDPWGNVRIAGSATAELNREDFGLSWNRALESGGWLVGRQVRIELSAEALLVKG